MLLNCHLLPLEKAIREIVLGKTGCRGRQPLPVCARFNLLLVGAIQESPFRTVGDACPYKFCGIFDSLCVGEDIILPFARHNLT